MVMGEEEQELLVEEREAEMVPLNGSQQPIKRKAWFLQPTLTVDPPAAPLPLLLPKMASFISGEAPHVSFAGWQNPQGRWRQWVDKLRPVYGHLWQKVGIFSSIQASTCKIRSDRPSIFGVAMFWNEETNTFCFPWSEATVTLEDVMVLGDFSVTGEPVRGEDTLAGELKLAKMVTEMRRLHRSTAKKLSYSECMRQFMEGEGDEAEHIAFLSLWLSRHVLTGYPGAVIRLEVLPIAIRLARGVRIALAPAVLAGLYRGLRLLKYGMTSNGGCSSSPLVIWAPFQILQLWLWERFMALRPMEQNCIEGDQPRAARWDGVGVNNELRYVRAILTSSDQFCWRPYSIRMGNWHTPGFYRDTGEWVSGEMARNEVLRSFSHCLRSCELVGMDCIEQYLPHRVAMQFGLDQDIPCFVPRGDSAWEIAWRTYEMPANDVRFYLPPRLFESDVTLRYSIWWKKHKLAGAESADAAECVMRLPVSSFGKHSKVQNGKVKRKKNFKEVCSIPKKKYRRVEDIIEPTLSEWLVWRNIHSGTRNEEPNSKKFSQDEEPHIWKSRDNPSSPAQTDTKGSPEMGEDHLSDLDPRELRIPRDVNVVDLKPKCTEKLRDSPDALGQTDTKGTIEILEDYLSNLDTWDLGVIKDVDVIDFASGSVVATEAEESLTRQQAKLAVEEMQKDSRQTEKVSKFDMQIKKLREEIAAIQAELTHLESLAEALGTL